MGLPTGHDDPFFQDGGLAEVNRDDPFFRGGEYMWTPSDEIEVSRDDPFFREGEYMWAPSDQKVEPADTNGYMWAEATVGQKV